MDLNYKIDEAFEIFLETLEDLYRESEQNRDAFVRNITSRYGYDVGDALNDWIDDDD